MESLPESPVIFPLYVLIFFFAIAARYFLAAGLFHAYFFKWNSGKFTERKLGCRMPERNQIKKEMAWSLKSSVIFALAGAVTFWLWQQGLTAVYLEVAFYGYWYLPLSLVLALLLHETYYYWIHRAMHHRLLFRRFHKVHHDSLTPTPWTAFSFHPWEALLEAVILPVILMIIPMHLYVLSGYLLLMTLSSVVNHLDIEIYPASFRKSRFGKLLIGATHHHYHHEEFRTNYGLYFTFWDRIMGTESQKMGHEKEKSPFWG